MKRRVWGIICVTSLVLTFATVVLWGRSYFRAYSINRTVASGDRFDGEERETFIVSNRGWFFLATNWQEHHHEENAEEHRPGKRWTWLSFPPPNNYLPPAYFPRNYQRPDGGYGRSSGFDARVVSVGHFIMHSRYKNDWTNRATWAMSIPHWLVVLILLFLPGIALRRRLRERRRRRLVESHRCPHCGYDLRASGQYCPECGKPVEAADVGIPL